MRHTKVFCDICEKEVPEKKCMLPVWSDVPIIGSFGVEIDSNMTLVVGLHTKCGNQLKDICRGCAASALMNYVDFKTVA